MSNVQWAKDIYAAFGRGDTPAVLAGFHPDIEWREAEGNPYEPSGIYRPSGKSLDAQVCHVLRFRDRKLLSFQQYVDTAQLQAIMATP